MSLDWSRQTFHLLGLTIFLTIMFVVVTYLSGGKVSTIALFPLGSVLFFLLTSFELCSVVLVGSLFVDYHLGGFSSAVWFTLPFASSFLARFREIEWKKLSNPMTTSILVYGVAVAPSFLNATQPLENILRGLNVVAFIIVLYSMVAALQTYDHLRRVFAVYLALVCVNALHVIIQSFAGESRPFGFAGIMFVDYVSLGICVTAAMSLVSVGKKRILPLLLMTLFVVSLILTQTRSAWLATAITLVILAGYVVLRPQVVGPSRRLLVIGIVVGSLSLVGIGTFVISMNPRVQQRATQLTREPRYGFDEWGGVENSFFTRLLIWDTALNAFVSHPIVGIGVYGFPFSSKHYSKMPKLLYDRYVKGLSPHQTHLAVITETGIIGALGFGIFLVTALVNAFRTISRSTSRRGIEYSFVSAIAIVYCSVSMFFTDAWLWGQGIVLLGLVIGLVMANLKISGAATAAEMGR